MATYGSRIRRGLPRQSGGEPWPPAGANVPDEPTAAEALTGARAIRRGLPRVAGGEPWPLLTDAQSLALPSAPILAADVVAAADDPKPAIDTTSASGDFAPPVADAPAAVVDAQTLVSTEMPTGTSSIRRGLPRIAGGEAWPLPTDAQSLALVTSADTADAAAPPEVVPEPIVPETVVPETLVPETVVPETVVPETVAAGVSRPSASVPVESEPKPNAPSALVAQPVGQRGQWSWRSMTGIVTASIAAIIIAALIVLLVRWMVTLEFMQSFLTDYPGEYALPAGTEQGFPAWVQWQHFFNMFFIVLIIKTGLQVRNEKRPTAFWTPKWSKNGKGKISLALWLHQSLDILWLLNGIIFVVLLFATGHWARIVPTSLEVFPNALSAIVQYVSLDWPTENGWVNYNSLQQLAYFGTVFIAAPLAAITGVRMSGLWPKKATTLSRVYPVEWARAVHFPVMLYFVVFIIFHVTLVLATGALRNLNHMYAGTDVVNWVGFWIFVGSVVLVVVAWFAARPVILAPIAKLSGKVTAR